MRFMKSADLHLDNAFPANGNWTDEQLKLAFMLYCQLPFGRLHSKNKEVVELAILIGRTPGSLAMKLVNFASLDPAITDTGRKGLSGASVRDRNIWDQFNTNWTELANECNRIRSWLQSKKGEFVAPPFEETSEFDLDDYSGETRKAMVNQRVNQNFFRRAVLASYGERCCLSGVSEKSLLVASHIIPWRADTKNRLNPCNGLCLSSLHDKAYDSLLFSLSDDCCVVLSGKLKNTPDKFLRDIFWPLQGKQIILPEKFRPNIEFIKWHREKMLENDS